MFASKSEVKKCTYVMRRAQIVADAKRHPVAITVDLEIRSIALAAPRDIIEVIHPHTGNDLAAIYRVSPDY